MTMPTDRIRQALDRRTAALLAALATLLAMAPPAADAAQRLAKPSALPTFPSCRALLSYARRNARVTGGRTGVPMRAAVLTAPVLAAPRRDVAAQPMPVTADSQAGAAAPSFSTTNVQEAGVDEPDIVKTDGRTVFAVADGRLRAIDVGGATPRVVGTLELDDRSGGHQLLLRGDRLLVLGNRFGGGPFLADSIAPAAGVATLAEVDVSDPAGMRVLRTMTLEGALVDARLTGGTARVVVGTTPELIQPAAIARTTVRSFVPRTILRSNVSGRTFRRSAVGCRAVRHPRAFSGLDLLTVLTIDLDKGLFDVDRDAIMAGAQTVYASPTSLYVASRRYAPALDAGRAVPADSRTEIHRFDAATPGRTSYASSGSVPGFVLNQYALSEHDGALRVASTEEPIWFEGRATGEAESAVSVLAEHGSRLVLVGRVGGLGRGERIYAVRFVGDRGYVVTFRQVDPLYVLDLSRRTAPRVAGELKLLGYSAYLHPISDELLLGVGQDATAEGRRKGAQLSLFDISDPRRPTRTAQASLGADASSSAEFDPHAFLYWGPSRLAVVPLSVYGPSGETFGGAVGFTIGAASIAERGRIAHPLREGDGADGFRPPIARSLVVGDRLYTVSYAGLAASRLDTLATLSFTAFEP